MTDDEFDFQLAQATSRAEAQLDAALGIMAKRSFNSELDQAILTAAVLQAITTNQLAMSIDLLDDAISLRQ